MSYSAGLLVFMGMLGGVLCAGPQNAPEPHLTGRELFYNTASSHAARPQTAPSAKPKPTAVSKNDARPAPPPPTSVEGTHVIRASAIIEPAPSSPPAPALGLKYTVLKLVDNDYAEVAPNTVFHAGDRVRFSVEPNGPGYLYIVKQGTSGMWEPVFPSAEAADANNRVEGWRSYMMPPKARLAFDEQTGAEKIFIVLSRVEVPDFERLMFSLRNGGRPVSAPQDKPAPRPKTLVASLAVDDATVGRLRESYARDLIIEKVDDDTPGPRKEKAVYVVNPTGSSDSRVVADIELVHK